MENINIMNTDLKQRARLYWLILIGMSLIIIVLLLGKSSTITRNRLSVATARNVVATLTASAAANYTQRKFNIAMGTPLNNCGDILKISGKVLPPGYTIVSQDVAPDKVTSCLLNGSRTKMIFNVIGV